MKLTDGQRMDLQYLIVAHDPVRISADERESLRAALSILDALRTSENAAANRATPDATPSASQAAEDALRRAYEVLLANRNECPHDTDAWRAHDEDACIVFNAASRVGCDVVEWAIATASMHGAVDGTVSAAVSPPDAQPVETEPPRPMTPAELDAFNQSFAAQPVVATTPATMCEACDGHGEIVYRDQSDDPWHERSVECEACSGTGKANAGTVSASIPARPAAADVAATVDDAAAPAPVAWRYEISDESLRVLSHNKWKGELGDWTETALYAVAPPPREPSFAMQVAAERIAAHCPDVLHMAEKMQLADKFWRAMYDAWMQEGRR